MLAFKINRQIEGARSRLQISFVWASEIEMLVNLKRALGITLPLALLGRADEVIAFSERHVRF